MQTNTVGHCCTCKTLYLRESKNEPYLRLYTFIITGGSGLLLLLLILFLLICMIYINKNQNLCTRLQRKMVIPLQVNVTNYLVTSKIMM